MLGPVLTGPRIRLEPPRSEYFPTYLRWFADPVITRYLMQRHPPSLRQEEAWYERMAESRDDVVWTIVLPSSGLPIGATGLHRIDWRNRHAFNGILLGDRAEWGKGYATEAIRLETAYAFQELNLEKVLTEVYAPNAASRRTMERAGFQGCGVRRRNVFLDGEWHDEWLGEILRDEWVKDGGIEPSGSRGR
jgi:[ribosomal protein S5]-alanine N-acetyltransferase